MEEEYYKRIDDNFLKADYVDGEILQHTDLNELENVVKTAVNANYEDIQKLRNGTYPAGDSEKLDGATLSKYDTETLQASDTKVPTSMQVKEYVDTEISHIDLDGYYTKREVDTIADGKQAKVFEEIIGRTEDNPFNLNTCDAGTYLISDSYIIFGDLTSPMYVYSDMIYTSDFDNNYRTIVIGNEGYYLLIYRDENIPDIYTVEETSGQFTTLESVQRFLRVNEYIKSTDYPTSGKAGVIRVSNNTYGASVIGNSGQLYANNLTYANYLSNLANTGFISKGTLENVIAGKGLLTLADLASNGYVKNTDYANNNKGGAIKTGNNLEVNSSGVPSATTTTYAYYDGLSNGAFIGKGTLENVINGKLVTKTTYASNSTGGAIRTSADSGTYVEHHQPTDPDAGNNGILRAGVKTYSEYTSALNTLFIGKGTLENVITGKGLVSNTDYATSSTGGVIKVNMAGFNATNGVPSANVYTYANYQTAGNNIFIGKGTLENVLNATIGDIDSVLDAINGEVI